MSNTPRNFQTRSDMIIKYIIKDKDGHIIASDVSTVFIDEISFRNYMRKEMKRYYPTAHYCEYAKTGLSWSTNKFKTIANF